MLPVPILLTDHPTRHDGPIVALKWGTSPYGFIGRFQALSCEQEDAQKEILKLLIKNTRMIDAYIEASSHCKSFDIGNALAEILPAIESLAEHQVDRLIAAFNGSVQLQGSYGFNGEKPSWYGRGLPAQLKRLTGRSYRIDSSGIIRAK